MNCTQVEAELLATGVEPQTATALSAEGAAHLQDCAPCRQLQQQLARLDQTISVWRAEPIPSPSTDELWTRISSALTESSDPPVATLMRRPEPHRGSGMVWITAAALAMMLAIGWGLRFDTPSVPVIATNELQPPVVDHTPSSPAVLVSETAPVSETVATLWQDMQQSSRAVAESTVASLEQLPRLSMDRLAAVTETTSGVSAPVSETPSAQTDDGGNPLTWPEWSAPLGLRVSSAFRFLEEALPDRGRS
jgi:hypothetical protein